MKLFCFVLLGVVTAGTATAQTQIDLRTQSRNVDFSQAVSSKPVPVGTTLPTTCSVGALYFKSDAPAGSNLFGCVGLNTWNQLAGAAQSGGAQLTVGLPFDFSRSATVLTVGANCTAQVPCRARIGATVFGFVSPATATVSSGSGTVYVYLDSTGALTFGVAATGSPALACSGCQAVSGVVSFPPDSLPLASWGVTSGLWDAVGTDLRTMLSTGPVLKAGQNVALASTLSTVTISAAGATGLLLANPSARTSDISDSSFTQESPNNGVASPRIGGGAVLPVCVPESRGMFFHLEAARGLADSVRVCTKDASGRYLWRKVF